MSVYNGADILPITLPSIIKQDYSKQNTEIIVVDDSSTDESINILKSNKYSEFITVILHSKNKGRSSTRNTGIQKAKGDIIIFIDCDIEVKPNFISQHVKYHLDENVIGLVSNIHSNIHLKTCPNPPKFFKESFK